MDGSSHADKCEVFEGAGIELSVRADLDIVSNSDNTGVRVASDVDVVLNDRVLADVDGGLVSTNNSSVPERGTLTKVDVADDSGIGGNPVRG